MALPIFASPIATRIAPAITVATASAPYPYWEIIPATTTINAPVGPPIWTFEPPKTDMMNPATIAV